MSINGLLNRQISNSFDTNGWFVAVMNALEGVTVEQACRKPTDDVNCIWKTLAHLTYYNHAYVERFKGVDYEYDVSSNDETFSVGEYDEAEWQAEVSRFNAVMTEFRDLIAGADEAKFDKPVSATNHAKWSEVILHISSHNAYHGGQIMLLRKLQGNWDPSKGVS